jgi:prolyl oligopeptidase
MNMYNTNRYFICFCLLISFFFITGFDTRVDYPRSKTVDVFDTYHGQVVTDPYRWLEDDKSSETAMWVEAQNKITFDYLESIPEKDKINNRLTEIWDYEKVSAPFKRGGKYFYYKNEGLQNQSILYSVVPHFYNRSIFPHA